MRCRNVSRKLNENSKRFIMATKAYILFLFFTFITILTPGQTVTIDGLKNGYISKDSLELIKTIDIGAPFKIYSFVMIYFANGKTKEFEGHANIISKEMTEVIQKSKTGDRFSFEQIKVTDNKVDILMKPILLKIK